MATTTDCPMCGSAAGFAFGTCGECGFNHLDKTFHFIKVAVEDLPPSERAWLVAVHKEFVQRERQ